MGKYNIIATSAFGIESVVAQEVKDLGYTDIQVENGRINYVGNEEAICKSNIWLRCADRVYINLAEFTATTFEELFQGVKAIPWENYLPDDAEFPVNAKSVKSQLFSLSDIQAISKKAAVERMKEIYQKAWFSRTLLYANITISILKDKVTVMLDTSGIGLHKRGYREVGSRAPLKETLAAAMVKLSRFNGDRPLIDPFCGSGTIGIEAAMIGRNIAPGLGRKFASESWDFISSDLWKQCKKEAYEAIDYDKDIKIYCSDIDRKMTSIAMNNAEEAGVDDCIIFETKDVKDLKSDAEYGYIIANPPYGERLGELEEVTELYKTMGEVFNKFDTWSYYVITSYDKFEKVFGKECTKNRKLYNGRIKCYLYQYYGPKPPRKEK